MAAPEKFFHGALFSASGDVKADKELVIAVVAQDGCELEFASDDLKANKEVALVAVATDGRALEYVSEHLKADKEVVMTALASNRYGQTRLTKSEIT